MKRGTKHIRVPVGVLCCIFLAAALLSGCGKSQIYAPVVPASLAGAAPRTPAEKAKAALVNTARTQIGTPYRRGGQKPGGFDCSGLVMWTYNQHGIKVPRTTAEQMRAGQKVSINALQAGDILVFRTRSGLHTGIYTGRGTFIHSPSSGSRVREDKLGSEYWAKAFREGRRIF